MHAAPMRSTGSLMLRRVSQVRPDDAMRAFLQHVQAAIVRLLPDLDLLDPGLTVRITASVPETASRRTLDRFKALLEEVWSTYCGVPVEAKIVVVVTREPFAAALAVQKGFAPPEPGSIKVRWEQHRGAHQ